MSPANDLSRSTTACRRTTRIRRCSTTRRQPDQVFEGQSHAQYYRDASAPETKEAFEEIARFFDKHLGK